MKLVTNMNGCKLITYKKGQVMVNKDGACIGQFSSLEKAALFAAGYKARMTTFAAYHNK